MFPLCDEVPKEQPPLPPLDASAVLGVVAGDLDDAALAERLTELHRLRNQLDAALAETSRVFDARAGWARDGARNGPTWVTARTGTSHGRAKGDIVHGRALCEMPVVAAAHAEGRLSREQVDALVRARTGLEPMFASVEAILADEVARTTLAGGQRFLRRWVAEVRDRLGLDDGDGSAPTDPSGVHLSPTFEGRWRLDGNLTTEQGEILAGAIEGQVDDMFRTGTFTGDDGLSPAERRAIALVELVTRGTRSTGDDGCARPLVLGVLDLRPDPDRPAELDPTLSSLPIGLAGRPPGVTVGMAEAEWAGVIPRETVERWLCEGTFQAVVIGPDGELNMGRKVRTATRAQRRALRLRDGHCVFPGCSAGPHQCQAYHIIWWEHDGPTDLDNLVLLCRYHHQAVHDRGFTITRDDGIVEVRRPDGSPVTSVRCPRADARRGRPPPRAREPIDQPDPTEVMETRAIRRRVDALIAEVQGPSPARP
ncbi:DUF222 domain-containing protein [Iamia sp. SCSIO 61187]|uniref:HNH endonuclease signature motif containing protein n=1 Tax=Iamia sp. SCSIO 61187 TaxID=2722752 RepID=UPI001C6299B0|nr:HNH endonuclease signature motif containing protein [Iamia sp. SCSIO 61187]QYG94137.1 DUF222 domain-containing protein [Iamia sp. SCSIO 61187]